NYNNTNNLKKLIANCFKLKTKVAHKGNKMRIIQSILSSMNKLEPIPTTTSYQNNVLEQDKGLKNFLSISIDMVLPFFKKLRKKSENERLHQKNKTRTIYINAVLAQRLELVAIAYGVTKEGILEACVKRMWKFYYVEITGQTKDVVAFELDEKIVEELEVIAMKKGVKDVNKAFEMLICSSANMLSTTISISFKSYQLLPWSNLDQVTHD
ncbi:hypothetical protein ACLWG8_000319, partial [Campylobacter jejuni]